MADVLPIVGPAYDLGIPSQNQQKLVNWCVEQDPAGGSHPTLLRPTPGMKAFSTVGATGSIRGLMEYRGLLYCVADHALYSVTSAGTATKIGDLNTTAAGTSAPVSMAASGTQMLILDTLKGYVFDITAGTVMQVQDLDFPTEVVDCETHDGFFVVVENNSEKFYISAAADATSWNALDFASANTSGDYLKACVSDQRELWLFGDKTTEVWFNSGNADFPFERREGVMLSKGLASKDTVVQSNNSLYWLAKDNSGQNMVVRANGYNPVSVTNQAIAAKLTQYTTSDAIAYVHREGLHEFYVLTLPTDKITFVYDFSNEMWHERKSHIDSAFTRHRGNACVNAFNKSLVGDYQTGKIYEYDEDTYDEDGAILLRHRRTPPLYINNDLLSISNFQLDFEPGVGLESGQGVDPQVVLKLSKDGGHTWGNDLFRSMGAQGTYNHRVKWDVLGQARDFVIDIKITDPVNAVLLGATAQLEINK